MKNSRTCGSWTWLLLFAVVVLSSSSADGSQHRHRIQLTDNSDAAQRQQSTKHVGVRRRASSGGLKSLRKGLDGHGKTFHRRTVSTAYDVTAATGVNDVTVEHPSTTAAESKKQMVWLNFTEANREILQLIHKKYGYKNEKLMIKKRTKMGKHELRQKTCHSIAMLQCGCNALTSFEIQLNSSDNVAFFKKCEIREKFFKCLDGAATATCRHSNRRLVKPKSVFKQRMREIVRVLWTTRGCILGTDDSSQSLRELDIDSSFCSSFHHHHIGSKRSRGSTGGGKPKKGRKGGASAAAPKQQEKKNKQDKAKGKNRNKNNKDKSKKPSRQSLSQS